MQRYSLVETAAFCSIVAAAIAAIGLASLIGVEPLFDDGKVRATGVLLRALSVSLCALNLPLWAHKIWSKDTTRPQTLWKYPTLQLLLLAALAVLGAVSAWANVSLWWVAAFLAVPSTMVTLWTFYTRSSKARCLGLVSLAMLFGAWTASMAWGSMFLTPVYEAKLVLGTMHIDTLFHVTIANMLDTFGWPSTGVDGAAYVPYNFGSHLLFLLMAHLIGASVLAFYNLAYPVLVLPWLYLALIGLALSLREAFYTKFQRSAESIAAGNDGWLWLVLVTGFVGVLKQRLSLDMGVWNNIMRGESFALAMTVLFLTLSAMFWAMEDARKQVGGEPPRALGRWALWQAPLALAVVGLAKITVVLAALPALGYTFLRLKLYRARVFLLAAALIVISAVLVYAITQGRGAGAATQSHLSLFHFFRTHVRGDLRLYSPLFYFFWVWVLIGLRIYSERVRTLGDIWEGFAAHRYLDVELIVVLAITSSLPGMLLELPAGAANYFSEVHNWVTLAFVMACAGPIVRSTRC